MICELIMNNFRYVRWFLQSNNRLYYRTCVKREVAQGSISLPSLSPGRLKQADLESTHAHHRLSILARPLPQPANSDSLSSPPPLDDSQRFLTPLKERILRLGNFVTPSFSNAPLRTNLDK